MLHVTFLIDSVIYGTSTSSLKVIVNVHMYVYASYKLELNRYRATDYTVYVNVSIIKENHNFFMFSLKRTFETVNIIRVQYLS